MNDVSRNLRRRQTVAIVGVGALLGVALVALGARLVHINTTLSPKLTTLKQGQYVSRRVLPARRGTIFDSRGRVLGGSRELWGVFADPALVTNVESTSARLGTILGLEAGEIEQALRGRASKRFCWIKRRVPAAEADAIRQARLSGVGLLSEPVRHYPLGSLAGQVLGFVGVEGGGLDGIELLHDRWLSGKDGQAWVLRDTRRQALTSAFDSRRHDTPARDGGHILLTIDSAIQSFVERSLAERVERFEALRGVAVVMDPRSGDVLAMANYPGFEPNHYSTAPAEVRRNRVVTDMAEPGSIFKPFVASAALAEGVVRPGEMFNTHNGLYVIGRRLLHDDHPYGYLTFENIVAKSSNIGMAQLGERLGNEAMYRALRRFGFGRRTGIDILGEGTGSVQPLERWTAYTTSSVPMGQEIAATPLQLITAFSAICNDGILLRPRLVRAKLSPEG
ncbi:MAG: peptidoglycan D,D-transpeptidase FtsI family protein, partial [Phycisphaerae bacterium]